MNVIDRAEDGRPVVVQLTAAEDAVADRNSANLDKGYSVPFAAKLALNWSLGEDARRHGVELTLRTMDYQFVRWLSDGTVSVRGKRFYVLPESQWQGR